MREIKLLPLSLLVVSISAAAQLPNPDTLVWHAITFGQSTDVNFATNVLPEKVGLNQVTQANGQRLPEAGGRLITPVEIESRGGKIGNSHDGLTFYYTRLPVSANMQLDAEISVDQFGPENGAMPAGQEGAGLLVRDVLGKARAEVLRPGDEEFPAAANMVMNALLTEDKKSHNLLQVTQIARNGVEHEWGNAGVEIIRQAYHHGLDIRQTPRFRLRLARTDDGFISGWAAAGSDNWETHQIGDAQRVAVLDKEGYYVGFFASRNARITVHQASLTLSEHHGTAEPSFIAAPQAARVEIASAALAAQPEYHFQLRSNQDGRLNVSSNGKVLVEDKAVTAGEMQSLAVTLGTKPTQLAWRLVTRSGASLNDSLTVTALKLADAHNLYVSPQGKAGNNGSRAQPLDVATAAAALAPGGTLWLADGDYSLTTLAASVSGTPQQAKKLRPLGRLAVFHGLNLEASHWDIAGITVTEKSFNISGSYNRITQVVAHHADDTGIWVASPAGIGRALWASHNIISHSESYANQDPGQINADGFAVKMRVGDGNKLIACFSHDNVDDGFDLFNKIEDGPNGEVTIENSVAQRNRNNGFKLGGEGLPVAHQISASVAIENGMDGFTDNFNPGALIVSNNIAIDNKRFNYLFRPGPYTQADKQGVFNGNISLRSQSADYADAVSGQVKDNHFLTLADNKQK
ncbi:right-handed parallel beta-helix repeat-containing protein [Pantoea sp. B65]|uniref:right-handed parallel beta-helix repeat-containing protein n=1 Tax=Pantoea sp. B65 TaxID=2813359 RepID=UPI0039B57B87